MKKLFVIMATVLGAACIQAASLAWDASAIPACGGDALSNAANYMGYLIVGQSEESIMAALESGNISTIASSSAAVEYVVPKRGEPYAKVEGSGSYDAADGVKLDGYMVILNADASQYLMANLTAEVAEATHGASFSFGPQDSATWASVPTSGGDVPEPTSGLLMLVGGAMLALRRKQK